VSTLFTINFRREAYRREVARARRRVVLLSAWLAYFGVLSVVLGLYSLNCASLTRRSAQIERQAERMRALQKTHQDWTIGDAELAAVEQFHANPRRWRDKLVRLATLLPPNAIILSIAVNPDNLPGPQDQNKLVITGELKVLEGQDRIRGVVQLVTALHADSLFASGYQNIRLASSRISEGSSPVAEFVIECR
jgi:Tfp pilus assembly protein PilN